MAWICVTWDGLLVLLNPPQDSTSCRAGARPGHPISRHMQCSTTLLFNHFVGAGEQCYRNFDANSFGRFRVDYQLQFRWPLDWQVGRICAFEYLVNERCRSRIQLSIIGRIRHEPAVFDELFRGINSWDLLGLR